MRIRRAAIGGFGIAGAVLLATTTAWACVSGPAVSLSTVNAKPGQEVQLTGTGFRQPDPATVRWNALDGAVLATFAGPDSSRNVGGPFTVPADAKAGNYVVVVTQSNAEGKLTQMPIRALLTVTPEGGAQPVVGSPVSQAANDRPAGLVSDEDSISGSTLALIGLGVAGVGMFLAGIAALVAGRRSPVPEAARARN